MFDETTLSTRDVAVTLDPSEVPSWVKAVGTQTYLELALAVALFYDSGMDLSFACQHQFWLANLLQCVRWTERCELYQHLS